MSKKTVQDIVVERLIEKIEQDGRLPWQKPFQGANMNWYSKHEYTGINKILLDAGEYLTTNQLEAYNKSKGTRFWFEKGTPSDVVVFYSKIQKLISDKEAQELISKGYHRMVMPTEKGWVKITWLLRYYRVFNIKYIRDVTNTELLKQDEYKDGIFKKKEIDVGNGKKKYLLELKGGKPVLKDGVTEDDFAVLEPKLGTTVIEEHTPSEQIIENYRKGTGVNLRHGGSEAYYTELNDSVTLPPRDTFLSTEAYCRVLFHEFIHSTGIESRLNRSCFKEYHDTKIERSKEELIAEVGGLLLASEAGFRDDTEYAKNSENYVANWCKWMKDNPNEVVTGFFAAEKAKNYILSGGQITNASSTRSIDNPDQQSEDGDVDVESDILDNENTSNEKSESTNKPPTSNNKDNPNNEEKQPKVTTIKTIKGVKEYFTTYLAPYFKTDDEKERKRILDSVTGDDLRYIYKKITKQDMSKSVKRKVDAIEVILQALGM